MPRMRMRMKVTDLFLWGKKKACITEKQYECRRDAVSNWWYHSHRYDHQCKFSSLTATFDFTHSNSNKKPKVPDFFFAFRRKFIKNEAFIGFRLEIEKNTQIKESNNTWVLTDCKVVDEIMMWVFLVRFLMIVWMMRS